MSNTVFFSALVILTLVLIGVFNRILGIICDEFREGNRGVGLTMIAAVAAIVAAALPWWML